MLPKSDLSLMEMGQGESENVKCRVLFFKETMGLQIGREKKNSLKQNESVIVKVLCIAIWQYSLTENATHLTNLPI